MASARAHMEPALLERRQSMMLAHASSGVTRIRIEEERFGFFLLPALLLLLIEGFLAERKVFRPTVLAS